MKPLLALFLIWLAAMPVYSQSSAEAESKVLALERLWGQAAQLRDIKALESIFDDAMVYVHIDGRLMTKNEVLADTASVSAVQIIVESSFARSHGNTVIVTGVLHLRGSNGEKPYEQYGRYVDTWVGRDGRWVCVSSLTTEIRR